MKNALSMLLSDSSVEFKKMLEAGSDEEFINRMMSYSKRALFQQSVTTMTGPYMMFHVFDKLLFTQHERERDISPYSWNHYQLDQHFISKQQFVFATSTEAVQEKLSSAKVGDLCDLSWSPEGKAAVEKREQHLNLQATRIQMWCRAHLRKPPVPTLTKEEDCRHTLAKQL